MNRNQTSGCLPFFLAAIGYMVFSFFSRTSIGPVVWSVVALVVIPALAALSLQAGSPRYRQTTAFWAVLWAAVFYTGVNLIRLRIGIGSGEPGGTLLASLLVCVVYGGIAGGVAALVVRLRVPKHRTGEKK